MNSKVKRVEVSQAKWEVLLLSWELTIFTLVILFVMWNALSRYPSLKSHPNHSNEFFVNDSPFAGQEGNL